jgi:hypothetical protein
MRSYAISDCLSEFYVEWEMLQTNVAERIKNTYFMLNNLLQKSCRIWDNATRLKIPGSISSRVLGSIQAA